jgi:hypothetical protein
MTNLSSHRAAQNPIRQLGAASKMPLGGITTVCPEAFGNRRWLYRI